MDETPTSTTILSAEDLREAWPVASSEDRVLGFSRLPPDEAQAFFLSLSAREQAELVLGIGANARRLWLRLLAPDDLADVIQQVELERRADLLALVDEPTRAETIGLLAYAEDAAGGLMNPRFARLRPEMTMDEAISYLRRQARRELETIYYVYVLDREQRLLGVVSFRELFAAPPDRTVHEVMSEEVVTVPEEMDQEDVARLIADHDLLAVPVVDAERRIRGIITVDDIVDVVEEEATEDIQKLGGMAALDLPYLDTSLPSLLKKRAGWLSVLFLGELLTASAMGRFEDEIARAVVLALFVPLIISSGGNSGSQAATLIIRAMALGEVRLRDWWRVMQREVFAGMALGTILATLGMIRLAVWQSLFDTYGEHWHLVAITVGLSLVGVVLWGTVSGSMLPFVIRRLGADPASASAPFIATLVDVSGLVIYFEVARTILGGTLL
jgi:magnesium transporter